ncbi:DapH/DapD/GlmU-related protein [Bacillus sp. REN10]|uniref:DapH/DapD/GlmU-related protein n=1 Tax=Bacillus sp. REN10 TaxID=2782541 RepID=UPI00193AE570|nr:DapH/DapD/GlmU-related protein [Bacillus sp. REN10]
MKFDLTQISNILGIQLPLDVHFDLLGLVDSNKSNTLTFIDNKRFLHTLVNNKNISAVFVTQELANEVQQKNSSIQLIICEDPRYSFYFLYNHISKKEYKKEYNVIDNTASIHDTVHIAEYNVRIGKNVIIEPNVTILSDVVIKENSIIRAGTIIGSEGFEHKRTTKGILSVFHDGKVIIDSNVEIGANTCIDKGFSFRKTLIGKNTKIDNLVHIAHGVQIGDNCLIAASSMIAGSVTIQNDVWIGPNSSISNNINIGHNSFITIGSVVTRDVSENQQVTGNFAIPHNQFLNNFKKTLKNK